jgi:hypothetical protein
MGIYILAFKRPVQQALPQVTPHSLGGAVPQEGGSTSGASTITLWPTTSYISMGSDNGKSLVDADQIYEIPGTDRPSKGSTSQTMRDLSLQSRHALAA